jgi:hypothetical protein
MFNGAAFLQLKLKSFSGILKIEHLRNQALQGVVKISLKWQ